MATSPIHPGRAAPDPYNRLSGAVATVTGVIFTTPGVVHEPFFCMRVDLRPVLVISITTNDRDGGLSSRGTVLVKRGDDGLSKRLDNVALKYPGLDSKCVDG